jgi:DNA primase
LVNLTPQDRLDIFDRHCTGIQESGSDSYQYSAQCPFHDDTNPTFSFNIQEGVFSCKKPTCEAADGGNIATFLMKYYGIDSHEVPSKLMEMGYVDRISDNEPIDKEVVEKHHSLLMKNDQAKSFLKNHRGINEDSMRKFKLGYDGSRLLIPVRDVDGAYVNVRKYSTSADAKYLPWDSGYSASLFPINNLLDSDLVLLVEGELDAVLADQLGYPSLTTFGANTWSEGWNHLFANKIVYICYDNDDAGDEGRKKVAKNIYEYASSVNFVDLPVEEKGADFTDYIHVMGHSKDDFDNLMDEAEEFIVKDKPKETSDDDEPYKVKLGDASHKRFYQKEIETEVLVTGKATSPSIIPDEVTVTCDMDRGEKICNGCPMKEAHGVKDVEIDDAETVVDMMNTTKHQQNQAIKKHVGIKNCNQFEVMDDQNNNIEEVRVIPEVDIKDQNTSEYVVRDAFYVGHGIETNKSFRMKGKTIAHPRTQKVTHLFDEAVPLQDTVDNFVATDDVKDDLEIFRPDPGQSIEEKFSEIYDDLVANVTHIYQRNDLLGAVDLVYHSPLSFQFHDRMIDRGWLELLVLGDTRTGKTETVKSLCSHYAAGELSIGENSTYAGLVGGVEQLGDEWMMTWGKIPRNDKKMLIVDELSSLSQEEIGKMTGMRSSGVAEIVKIRTERTNARTRMVWMSNPRSNRTLSDFGLGVQAIPELIGKPEDISKFDMVVTCSSDEIDAEVYNQFDHDDVEHRYTSDLCHDLVMWVWSRGPDQVEFHDEAVRKILESAQWFGEKYSPAIPIVEAANQRIKLARISAAVAARMFSTGDEREKIIVKPEHAEFASRFLNSLLTKESLGYDIFSENRKKEQNLKNKEKIKNLIMGNRMTDTESFVDNMMDNKNFTKTDFVSFTGLNKGDAKKVLQLLLRNRAIKKSGNKFTTTTAFSKLLREIKSKDYGSDKNVNFI